MSKTLNLIIFAFTFVLSHTMVSAADIPDSEEKEVTSVELKYITGEDVISVLRSLIDESISISHTNNLLIIKGTENKTKTLLHIVKKIDTPPSPLTIEFIASSRNIDFNQAENTYQSGKSFNNTSQSMSITERQWVSLNTGISIPLAERKRYADGTETQSFTYKKVSQNYIFKVHEFSDWSVIQVGLNISTPSDDIAGAIQHTELDTTIVGKTGEWLEVASSKKITQSDDSKTYSTKKDNKKLIYLYVKVNKPETKLDTQPEVTE
ncbi:MAG: hypothetical protein OQK75_04345 [Gammaproteobacteria bacterium]|nr:hypothetical protein [Gammaproteobacteria bacterium]MCW8986881.1 hypothetical protein [Gammaproteobacteria bacterium]MCW9032237.1 hypothetical protein [Gammaproteobacteria bacterium]